VSLSQLLLRANPFAQGDDRVEILFQSVDWISLPMVLNGIDVAEVHGPRASELIASFHAEPLDHPTTQRVYRVTGNHYYGLVIAGSVSMRTDKLAYNAPSPWVLD
jgi:hypothetical protein